MNIFYLDKNPIKSARYHCDKHVVKMCNEYAQILATTHRILDGNEYIELTKNNRKIKRWSFPDHRNDILFKSTHYNNRCCVWVRKSSQHYQYLLKMWIELCSEYTKRYNKIHKAFELQYKYLSKLPKNILNNGFEEPPQIMDKFPEFKIEGDSVKAYRNFYIYDKYRFAIWSKTEIPGWFKNDLKQTIKINN